MIQNIRSRFSAMDPGRSRLKQAAAVSLGMGISAALASVVIDLTKASPGLLTVSIILAMIIGNFPHDATAKKRCVSTALMIIPLTLGATVSISLSGHQTIQSVLLVAVVGVATWVRMYGSRANVLGIAAFFGYFFPLLMHIGQDEFLSFVAVVTIAVCSQTLVRAFLIIEHPKRQFITLRDEFLRVSSALLQTAHEDSGHKAGKKIYGKHLNRVRRVQVQKLDSVAQAISAWQKNHDPQSFFRCDNFKLSTLVLNARMDIEDSVAKLISSIRDRGQHYSPSESAAARHALYELQRILDPQTHPDHTHQAAERIESLTTRADFPADVLAVLNELLKAADSFVALRDATHVKAAGTSHADSTVSNAAPPQSLAKVSTVQPDHSVKNTAHQSASHAESHLTLTQRRQKLRQWRLWQTSSKMSLQIMAATALATVTGQLISATHWYWAVLTVFLVFLGRTSRAGILTRASRRIFGTVGGLACGVLIVIIFHDQKFALVALAVLAAFCMMYFGPIKYSYIAFFVSSMLVGLYGLSGSLNTQVVLVRIDETILGAIIGVACAYLLFSTNTQPELQKRNDEYFAALDELLVDAHNVFDTAPPQEQTSSIDRNLLEAVHRLDNAYQGIHSFTADIAVAFVGLQSAQNEPDLHRLFVTTHLADQLSRQILRIISTDQISHVETESAQRVQLAIHSVQRTAVATSDSLRAHADHPAKQVRGDVPRDASNTAASTNDDVFAPLNLATSHETDSLLENLHRLNWSLQRIQARHQPPASKDGQSIDDTAYIAHQTTTEGK